MSQSKEYKQKYKEGVKLFKTGFTTRQISKKLNLDNNTFRNNLRKDGFYVPDLNKNITIRENIFEQIDTEEKAYWLGFLYADGWLSKVENRVSLCIKDRDHVLKYINFLNLDESRIKERIINGNVYYRASFRNKKIHQDLINKHCFPAKSLILKFPNEEIINKNFVNDFVRGYFDGDGGLGFYSKQPIGIPTIYLNGTKEFLDKIVKIYNLPNNKYGKDGLAYSYMTSSKNATEYFLNSLYKNANIYLDRKYKLFLNCRFR